MGSEDAIDHFRWIKRPAREGDPLSKARVVADYIAGMTDRYAIAEYERLQ